MRSLILLLILSVCPLAHSEIHDGVYVQQPGEMMTSNPELIAKYKERYEKDKITIEIDGNELTISMFEGADWEKMEFTRHGDTLVATDGDMYWIMYQRDRNTLVSTGMLFKRITVESP